MKRFILAFKNNTGNEEETIPSTDIIVSGGTNDYIELNGTYTLVDASAAGFNRKWKNSENDWYIFAPELLGGEWHFGKIQGGSVSKVGPVLYTDEPVGSEWDTTTDEIEGESTITTAWASESEEQLPTIPPGKRAFSISGADGEFADINGIYIEETYTDSSSIWKHKDNNITFEENGFNIGDAEYEQWYYKINRGTDKQFLTYDVAEKVEGGQRIEYPFTGFESQENWNNGSFNWDIHVEIDNKWTGGDWDGELEYKLTFSQVN